jgi:hypothetical protein
VYAPEELTADREIVLAAVQKHGAVLVYAPEELKADREIVLAAVQNHGRALQFASQELKADREIVLAAVQNHGAALEYASEELKDDPFVKALARRDVEFTCEYLENLGRLRPTVASELEALADKIVEIVKYFPELEQEAQDASAQVEDPRNDNGTYSLAHKRSRTEFEKDFNCG